MDHREILEAINEIETNSELSDEVNRDNETQVDEEEPTTTNESESERSNAFNLYQPDFVEGGPPTLVKLPTNVPLYPSYATLTWMKQKLPPNVNVDYYDQLLGVFEEMGRELRPVYAGNKVSFERFKRCINQAKLLITQIVSDIIVSSRETESRPKEDQQQEQQENRLQPDQEPAAWPQLSSQYRDFIRNFQSFEQPNRRSNKKANHEPKQNNQ